MFLLLTNLAPTKHTANKYKTRWKFECMFKHLKSNGYNLEDINLRDKVKAEFMLALVATSYILAIREGIQKIKQIVIKQYKDGSRIQAVSIFRKGLAMLTTICTNFESFLDHILSLTPLSYVMFERS